MRLLRRWRLWAAGLALSALLGLALHWTLAVARAYVFGYPLVLMDATRRTFEQRRPPARPLIRMRQLPDADFRDVVRPNVDTLYTSAFIDMALGPWLFELPPNGSRYEVMQFLDGWTQVLAAPGTRLNGARGGRFLLVPRGWIGPVPPDTVVMEAPSRMVWLIGRTQIDGAADLHAVRTLQDGIRLVRPGQVAAEAEPEPTLDRDSAAPRLPPPVEQVAALEADQFFSRLAALMAENPPAPRDAPMVDTLGGLGVVAGQSVRWNALQRWAAGWGRQLADAMVARAIEQRGQAAGWLMPPENIGSFGTDYATRMGVARVGLGANLPQDALYPWTRTDADGRPLDGNHRYRIRFPAGRQPPVFAFWSITAYGPDDFFIPNPLHRYALGSRDPLRPEPDGSLELLIQADPPAARQAANWLPVRRGERFSLNARLYWPRVDALLGTWTLPPVERLD